MTRDDFHALVMAYPGVEQGKSYGKPAYKVKDKFFTRVRVDDDSAVLSEVSFEEREMLIELEPHTFHVTAHYKDYPIVLARLADLDPGQARRLLERRWRSLAPRAMVKAFDAAAAAAE